MMDAPPLLWKLWLWLLGQANWKDRGKLKRGQLLTTISAMRDAMSWRVGYRVERPSRDQIRNAYEAFTKATMITTAKTTRGMIITILNYEKYQDPKNYEAHSESHDETRTKPATSPHDMEEREEGRTKKIESSLRSDSPVNSAGADSPETRVSPSGPPPCPHQKILDLYHAIIPTSPRVESFTPLKPSLKTRWREDKRRQSLDWWSEYFQRVAASDFLTGRIYGKQGPFLASLQWLIGPQNMAKVLNGQFDNRGPRTGSARTDQNIQTAMEWAEGK